MTKDEALDLALEALETKSFDLHSEWGGPFNGEDKLRELRNKAISAIKQARAAPVQEPAGPEPFGYFQYDIRLDAWVQNRINNKGAAFYTAGDIRALKHRIHDQDAMLERQTARIVDLQEHIENFDGEDR